MFAGALMAVSPERRIKGFYFNPLFLYSYNLAMQCFMSDYMKSLIYCVEGNVSRAICNCFLLSLEDSKDVFANAHFSRECLLEESSLHDDSVFICNYLRFLFSLRNNS